jgi:hypothetical protein
MVESSSIPSATPTSSQKPATLPVPNATSSFWLSDLDAVLKGHRSTEELPEYVDTIVVGSGITGATAAWELSKTTEVLVLEAREVSSGATGRVRKSLFRYQVLFETQFLIQILEFLYLSFIFVLTTI